MLRALKEDAEEYLGEKVTEAVISVPAYLMTKGVKPPREQERWQD